MRWIWIDRFIDFQPGVRAVAIKNVTRAEDHLHDKYPAYPMMPVSLIIEGMAQTAGILVGHARQFSERVILAKLKQVKMTDVVVPGDQLKYEAVIENIDDAGAMTAGKVIRDDATIGEVDIVFSHVNREAGRQVGIPEHNFVFSDDFKRLLGIYDIDHQFAQMEG